MWSFDGRRRSGKARNSRRGQGRFELAAHKVSVVPGFPRAATEIGNGNEIRERKMVGREIEEKMLKNGCVAVWRSGRITGRNVFWKEA